MKKTAIAAAIALASGSAHALDPAATVDLEIWVGGASAQDGSFGNFFTDLCSAGTLDTYFDVAGSTPGAQHRAFFCTIPSVNVSGLSGDLNVLLHKRSAGGSGQGVVPVARSEAQEHMVIDNGNCSDQGLNVWHCDLGAGNLENQVPDIGISDLEPGLFFGPNTSGGQPVTPSDVANLEVNGAVGLVFGQTVGLKLRNALQAAQDLSVGGEGITDMPSLTRQQIASLYTGRIKQWNQFTVGGTPITSFAGVTPPAPSANVIVCRRTPGSGTGAQMYAYYLNTPCNVAATAPLLNSGFGGPTIVQNSGSGDLEACQTDADAAGNWSIGVQSTEKNASLSKDYRFVKIDGVAPTIDNAASGKYGNWVEPTLQWRNSTSGNALAGDKLAIAQKLVSDLGSAATIAASNASFVHTFGNGGFMALPSGSNIADANGEFDPTNPVTPYVHQGANSCNIPTPSATNLKVPL